MRRALLPALAAAVVVAAPAAAHPLFSVRYDRTVAARVGAAGLTVRYTLELSHEALFLEGGRVFSPDDQQRLKGTVRDYAAQLAKKLGPLLADDLRATVDGRDLPLRVEKIDVDFVEHPRFRYTFRADWPPAATPRRTLAFEDQTFPTAPGVLNLTLDRDAEGGVTVVDIEEPPPGLRNRPSTDRKPGTEDDKRLRTASATFDLPPPATPPVAVAPSATPAPAVVPAPGEPTVTVAEGERRSLVADLFARGLPALFDSTYGLGVLLLAAGLFGAAHAFTPGHGKTLVAAYLVGERGTVAHAVVLAAATTVAHTGSVIAIAAVLYAVYGETVPGAAQGVLQFLGGALVAAVGLWLLLRRVAGKADHVHLFGDHHHHHHGDGHHHHHGHSHHHHHHDHAHDRHHHAHPHDHAHGGHHHHGPPPESARSNAGWVRLLLMGLGGGLIPCWDAVLLLLAAMSLNRLGFAVPLLLAFSAGLGAVLVGLGVAVVYAHKVGAGRFGDSRWFRVLPMVTAAALVAIGLWLCSEGLRLAAPALAAGG